MVLDPAATAVTRPVPETVATDGVPELHDTVRPVTTAPFTSRTVATRSAVPPMESVALPGATVTLPIAAGDTVIVAVPVLPSTVAVMVLDPAATAVTRPVLDTEATDGELDDQSTTRPSTIAPFTSRTVAAKSMAPPTVSEAGVGAMLTDAIGGAFTVTVADPVRPSAWARMITVPTPTAVTTPVDETVATLGDPLLQVMVRSRSTAPDASSAIAVRTVSPPVVSVDWSGVTRMDAIGTAETMTLTDALRPSLLTVTVVLPGATALTTPLLETATITVLSDRYVTGRPLRTFPAASVT